MNIVSTTVFNRFFSGAIVSLFLSTLLFAQIDNPMTDHVPIEYINLIRST